MNDEMRIKPYAANRFYWQYKGKPVLLIGGSVEDNLFQIPNLEEHLDLLASVGGNYVRCTMSCRDEGDVWPFHQNPTTGLYDMERPSAEYLDRFERFLELTAERDIIAQFEMWDRFDYARENWLVNPYNPKNNVNYTVEESGLQEEFEFDPWRADNPFFRTPPTRDNNEVVLRYQQAQVDEMLSRTLNYGHLLYCMDNETNEPEEWGWHWSRYIQAKAAEAGVETETTEMWDSWDILDGGHAGTFDHPEIYSFIDISQNSQSPAARHWSNPQTLRRRLVESGEIRPMNTVRIYGANTGRFGSTRDGQERFWRNIIGGLASSRFHRPDSGLGLGKIAQANIKSMRMLTDEMNVFECAPNNRLLEGRSWNEAFCTANPGVEYAAFFPDGGDVTLDVSAMNGRRIRARWLDIRRSEWSSSNGGAEAADKSLRLVTPTEEGYWAVLVQAVDG